jgi:hypothetical protein
MANVKLSLFVGSVTEVAVMVGEASEPEGGIEGGVYVAVSVGLAGALSVPHEGEQLTPFAVNAQVTPAPATSSIT